MSLLGRNTIHKVSTRCVGTNNHHIIPHRRVASCGITLDTKSSVIRKHKGSLLISLKNSTGMEFHPTKEYTVLLQHNAWPFKCMHSLTTTLIITFQIFNALECAAFKTRRSNLRQRNMLSKQTLYVSLKIFFSFGWIFPTSVYAYITTLIYIRLTKWHELYFFLLNLRAYISWKKYFLW